jgi:urease accessory protein
MKHHFIVLFTGVLSALSLPAEAHTGHAIVHDFQAGLLHPLLGIDHILAMAGVGLWAGFLGRSARGWIPGVFLASMTAGAVTYFTGITMQGAEVAVAMSVLAIGMILVAGWRSKLGWATVLSALFAYSHGYVHALEAGTNSQAFWYAGGFLVSTALLLGSGLIMGRVSSRYRWIKSVFGAVCAGLGLTLLFGI